MTYTVWVRVLSCCFLLMAFGYAQQSGGKNQGYPATLWVPCDEHSFAVFIAEDHWSTLGIDTTPLMADQEGRNCQVAFELLGFTAAGQVAMRTNIIPYYDVSEEPSDVPPSKRCVEKHQVWAVDPHTQQREPLASGFKAERYSVRKNANTIAKR